MFFKPEIPYNRRQKMLMKTKTRNWIRLGMVVFFLFFFLLLAWAWTGTAADKASEKPTWVWSEKFPKPSWFKWGQENIPAKPVRGGYYREATSAYIGLMNPNHWPINNWGSIDQIYDSLTRTDGELKPTVPWLAESWEYTSPQTVIMKFKKGIKFSDGSPFNAEVVKYQMEWIKDRKNGAFSKAWLDPIISMEVIDEYTLKWNFDRAWAGFLGTIAYPPGKIVSAKALKADVALMKAKKLEGRVKTARKKLTKAEKKAEKGGEKAVKKAEKLKKNLVKLEKELAKAQAVSKGAIPVDKHGVGTGRYRVEEARPGNYLKLKRNPDWWFGKSIGKPEMPYFDGRIQTVIPDPTIRLANFRAGKIDVLWLSPEQHKLLKNEPKIKIYHFRGNSMLALKFKTTKGPCKDIRVRKAISHAIDRQAIVDGALFGFGEVASCLFPTVHWCHNPDLKPVAYDLELSKKLLAEAGYEKGLTIKGYMGNSPAAIRTIAEILKNMLVKVNIDWQYDLLDPAATDDRSKNLEYDFAQGGWPYIQEPDLCVSGQYAPEGNWNSGRSNNEAVIRLIQKGREKTDMTKRRKMYYKIEELLYDNYEDAWLFYSMGIMALKENVMGFNKEMYELGRDSYSDTHPLWFREGRP